jgi:hypothetical protein
MSHNKIKDLSGMEYFPELRSIIADNNCIECWLDSHLNIDVNQLNNQHANLRTLVLNHTDWEGWFRVDSAVIRGWIIKRNPFLFFHGGRSAAGGPTPVKKQKWVPFYDPPPYNSAVHSEPPLPISVVQDQCSQISVLVVQLIYVYVQVGV